MKWAKEVYIRYILTGRVRVSEDMVVTSGEGVDEKAK